MKIIIALIITLTSAYIPCFATKHLRELKPQGDFPKVVKSIRRSNKVKAVKNSPLIGTWSLNFSDGTSLLMQVTTVVKGSEFLGSAFDFNVYNSDGSVSSAPLSGFIQGKKIFFTIPYVSTYGSYVASFNKNFKSGTVRELLFQDRICYETGLVDSLGLDVYDCSISTTVVPSLNIANLVKTP